MLDFANPNLIIETAKLKPGKFTWRSPSNIALIKYWGKHGRQLPRNPSVSFTLSNAYTETALEYSPKTGVDEGIDLTFLFHGQPQEAFRLRLLQFLESITDIFPFLKQMKLTLHSENSFPHSAGIASSASAMSALALCLCSLEDELFETLKEDDAFEKKASFVARLGSGSACRSVYERIAIWGQHGEVEGSSDLFAVPFVENTHPIFRFFHDDILIISKSEKSVSSTAGHALMDNNIYADNRYLQAKQRFHNILRSLETGDVEQLGKIVESEALTLHALMMASNYILMQPNTLVAIEKIRAYREATRQPVYFTLDAGPNIHLLYPDSVFAEVNEFVESELKGLCEDGMVLRDEVGEGPLEI